MDKGIAAESLGIDLADDCDGKEQEEFEAWAQKERLDMETHPIHWLFLDKQTNAARRGWRAGISYARRRALASVTTPPKEDNHDLP